MRPPGARAGNVDPPSLPYENRRVNGGRGGGIAGLAFVGFTLVWAILLIASDRPGYDSSNDVITDFWDDPEKRGLVLFAAIALSFAGVALLWFLGSLRVILRGAEGDPARLTTIAVAAGVVLVALMFVKNSIDGGLALALETRGEDFLPDPGTVRALHAVFLALLVHEGFAAAVLIGSVSLLARRTRVFPRWLTWSGIVVAIVELASWLRDGEPLILMLAWVVAVSVLMLRRPAPT